MVTTDEQKKIRIKLRKSEGHDKQQEMVDCDFQRIIAKCGRRWGKTVGIAKRATKRFALLGRRQMYAAPTATQCDAFWYEVCWGLHDAIEAGIFKKNETERTIERPGTRQRIKAKTAWNAQMFRGDFADDFYFDEFQLMNEDIWENVAQPMLMDTNGTALFAYTPPSMASKDRSQARDPRHASKLFKMALADTTGEWHCIHATSHENPYISQAGIEAATRGMSLDAYRREIMAEDDEIEMSWLVYAAFKEDVCKIHPIRIPEEWPIYTFHDFGSANPAALFVARAKTYFPIPVSTGGLIRNGDFVVFREYAPGGGRSTFEHIQEWKSYGLSVAYSVGGNQTTEDEIRQGYAAHGWPIVAPREKYVNMQIDRTRGAMERNRLWIFDTVWGLLSEIADCMWRLDDEMKPMEKIKDEHKYHRLACLRYGISDFDPDTIISPGRRGGQRF